MHHRIFGRGFLFGTSELCYRVLGAPQNRNIYTIIAGFLAGECGELTRDLCSLAFSCGFLHFWDTHFQTSRYTIPCSINSHTRQFFECLYPPCRCRILVIGISSMIQMFPLLLFLQNRRLRPDLPDLHVL